MRNSYYLLLGIAATRAFRAPPRPRQLVSRRAPTLHRAAPPLDPQEPQELIAEVSEEALGVDLTIQERLELFQRLATPYFRDADGAKLQFGLLLVLVLCQWGRGAARGGAADATFGRVAATPRTGRGSVGRTSRL